MRHILVAAIGLVLAAPVLRAQQVELDRTLERVYDSVVTTSDVRQVRLLKLADGGADTDAAAQTTIENRLLIKRELSRGGTVQEPAAERVAEKRETWRKSWPASTHIPALLARAGMSTQALDGWFRDELKIEAFLAGRYPQTADPKRAERIANWINDLRRRANLSAK
jgi:hypothetical protein